MGERWLVILTGAPLLSMLALYFRGVHGCVVFFKWVWGLMTVIPHRVAIVRVFPPISGGENTISKSKTDP